MNRWVAWALAATLLVAHALGFGGGGALGADVLEAALWVACAALFYLGLRDRPRPYDPSLALIAAAAVLALERRALSPDARSALVFAFGPLILVQVALAMRALRGERPSASPPMDEEQERRATVAMLERHARDLRKEGRTAEAEKLEAKLRALEARLQGGEEDPERRGDG